MMAVEKAYCDGFEAGVAQVKRAADPAAEMALSVPARVITGAIPFGRVTNLAASLYGLLQDQNETDRKRLGRASHWPRLIPLVTDYRIGRRMRGIADESKELGAEAPYANLISEQLGSGTALIAPAAAGALAGGLLGGRRAALYGGAAGAVVPLLAAGIAALVTKRRTARQQAEGETTERALMNYVLPGLGQYHAYKRLGASRNWKAKRKA